MGSKIENYTNSLLKLQKCAFQIITGLPFNSHTKDLFHLTNILEIQNIVNYALLFMNKCNKNNIPCMFNEMFIQNVNVHDHFTRQQNKLWVCKAPNVAVGKTMIQKY